MPYPSIGILELHPDTASWLQEQGYTYLHKLLNTDLLVISTLQGVSSSLLDDLNQKLQKAIRNKVIVHSNKMELSPHWVLNNQPRKSLT
jgi:hypothetical protein